MAELAMEEGLASPRTCNEIEFRCGPTAGEATERSQSDQGNGEYFSCHFLYQLVIPSH